MVYFPVVNICLFRGYKAYTQVANLYTLPQSPCHVYSLNLGEREKEREKEKEKKREIFK